MELYIIRHGIAEETSKSGRDRDRCLTDEGIEKTRLSAEALKRLGIQFDLILTSPFTRALQTAEWISRGTDSPEPEIFPPLASGEDSDALVDALAGMEFSGAAMLLTGHEPDLGRLISLLLAGHPDLGITMRKGTLCKLRCAQIANGAAQLEWMMNAKHLVKMA
jgi:phosphohistidine phosphatase